MSAELRFAEPPTSYKVPDEIKRIAREGVEEVIKKMELSLDVHKRPMLGTRPLAENTTISYMKHINGLRYFCSVVGDYESLLVFMEQSPAEFCPSANPNTIANFIRFKRLERGQVLVDERGQNVVDVLGRGIKCMGGWNDHENVRQCLSAIGAVHAARGQKGPYFDSCMDCIKTANASFFVTIY